MHLIVRYQLICIIIDSLRTINNANCQDYHRLHAGFKYSLTRHDYPLQLKNYSFYREYIYFFENVKKKLTHDL